jgi:exosortase A
MTGEATLKLRLSRDAGGTWRSQIMWLAVAWAALLLLFRRDLVAMVGIWWNSSTFNHVLFVPFLIGWLVSLRCAELLRLAPAAWWPGLAVVAVGGFGWLLGEAAGVNFARQLGLVVMMQGATISLLGPAVARALAFPLAYAFFLVPFGEALVPPLQTLTARMCLIFLHFAGVPAAMDGVFITIPNGAFRVAEACSGVKFLVAMLAYGALAANVCFTSWPRRIAFMTACAVVPVIANGLRAFGTIWIAHHSSSDFAIGFDHVFYGWIFFGLVIALIMGAAWPFFDRRAADGWFDVEELRTIAFRTAPARWVAIAVVLIAASPLAWSGAGSTKALATPTLPTVSGWTRNSDAPAVAWQPHFAGADRLVMGRYRDASGATVDLAIAVYARQGEGHELVGFGQGATPEGGPWEWVADTAPVPGGRAERIAANGTTEREVVSFYRVGNRLTGSDAEVKLETLKVRLIGGPQRAVAVLVSAEGKDARAAVDRFLAALGPVSGLADRAAGLE